MAHLLSVLVLALAVSLDGFGVGVTYGLRRIRIPFVSVLIIACCSGFIIWLSMGAGEWLRGYVSEIAAKAIGAAILIGIGCWALIQLGRSRGLHEEDSDVGSSLSSVDARSLDSENRGEGLRRPAATVLSVELKRLGLVIQILRSPQAADVDRSGIISPSEAVMLGVALSLDALGAGLGAALLGLPPIMTAIVIACSSALFLMAGTWLGIRFAARRGMQALSVVPGILLILMGIMKLL
ncbi:sporulation membrane protein YtaF [Paenibacillus sp. J5C_2022]|uniref:sporulation membrane protein YtaF n=1 Tax=Paenibacillus sp. J5C2022 TaxID=2977129 RepID=UPI0021D24C4A|nr:sporulation membrane protein YtaF [Paenibacillus sp. J5C2022]MCU6710470.1 sporulation membrane protein YtaF [Paenibacillus sp. J5C2022]